MKKMQGKLNPEKFQFSGSNLQDQLHKLMSKLQSQIKTQCTSIISIMEQQISTFRHSCEQKNIQKCKQYQDKYKAKYEELNQFKKNAQGSQQTYLMLAQENQNLREALSQKEKQLCSIRNQFESLIRQRLHISSAISEINQSRMNNSQDRSVNNTSFSVQIINESLRMHPLARLNNDYLLDHYQIEEELQAIKDCYKIHNISLGQIMNGNPAYNFDQFELKNQSMISLRHKKFAYRSQFTKDGILFTKIDQEIGWRTFVIYQSLHRMNEKKLSLKIHKIAGKHFSVGIGLKSEMIECGMQKKKNKKIIAYQPYSGKLRVYTKKDQFDLECLSKIDDPICEVKVNMINKQIRWQKNDGRVLYTASIPQQMMRIPNDLVVFFELHGLQDKIELLLK